MADRSTERGVVAAAIVTLALALAPGTASASGGGGCGGPVTDEAGTTVRIESFCFTPTIVRVQPGDTVTFVNRDGTTHTVLGANGAWGSYDPLKRNHEATYTFEEAGVFPYVCTWHPGMVGTVVVGDGSGGAIGTSTAAGPVIGTTLDASPVASSTALGSGSEGWRVAAIAGWALSLLTLGLLAVERRRRRSVA